MHEKPLVWVGSSLADLRAFPTDARRQAGYQLYRVQCGEMPTDWKPIPSVGAGVYEIRVHTRDEYRVFYVAKFVEAVYVLLAFDKHTRQTAPADLDLARQRLKDVMASRGRR
ncbi:MAG TPA: type II toxin-antitoxin system RelE/ParE family toxin [Gemmatimonadales bacterium]|jgi:phage-related protein